MRVHIGNATADLTDQDLLGVGGEARVYGWGGLAVKLYHPIPAGLKRAEHNQAKKLLQEKLQKIQDFPKGLPKEVIAPQQIVNDDNGQPIGFTMPVVMGAEDLIRLGQRKWRQGVVSNEKVTALFQNMHTTLADLHTSGVVIGDLNDSNVLFQDVQPWFIDADSMQFGKYLCVVGHERFLDPHLFKLDLTQVRAFTPQTDWYSFTVQLFSSLLYVHPYGGVCNAYPTLLRRAEAHHSILRDDVLYPKGASPYQILPDTLLAWFEEVFDKEKREVFPRRLLDLHWTVCGCGLEHARSICPVCATTRPQLVREAVQFRGKCRRVLLFQTRGRILGAVVQGNLKYLYEEGGIVRREDGTRVLEQELQPGLRFAIQGSSTWVGLGRELVRIHKEQPVERATAGMLGSLPVFDASSSALYSLQNEWLVESPSGQRVGKVLEGQTWLRVGERLGFGYYRAGLLSFFFLLRTGKPGLLDVKLPPIDGRLIEAEAVFDNHHVLFLLSVEKNGQRHNSMFLIGEDARVLAQATAPAEGSRMLASLQGKAVAGGRLLCATDQGLLGLTVDKATGQIHEGTLFTDTEPFVESGATVLPGPEGTVYLVTNHQIAQLSLA